MTYFCKKESCKECKNQECLKVTNEEEINFEQNHESYWQDERMGW